MSSNYCLSCSTQHFNLKEDPPSLPTKLTQKEFNTLSRKIQIENLEHTIDILAFVVLRLRNILVKTLISGGLRYPWIFYPQIRLFTFVKLV